MEQKTRSFNYCFAGVDKDAVDAARQHMFPSFIASMALFKNGELVHVRTSPH
jgi:putative YphP/YqiW family bacilliredoxin